MKKFRFSVAMLLLIFGALFVLSPKRLFSVAAAEDNDEIVWAQLKTDAELFEKDGEVYNMYTTLPETYFVALLEEETESEYIRVSYRDISGYVKKADIEITDYEPVTKYAAAYFTAANEGFGAILRSSPDHSGDNTLALIPDGEKFLYYGTVNGSARYDGASTVWYYVKYEKSGNDPIFGYVYAYHGTADAIPENKIEKVEKPAPPEPEPPVVTPEKQGLSGVYETVFIVCLCIPAAAIMFMLFRRAPQEKKKKKPRGYAD